jgi:drug/metabolite transporter (DMT)-like permease
MNSIPYAGETLSLLAAVLWALAVVLFKKSGETVHPVALNTFKNIVAVILYVPTLWIAGVGFAQPYGAGEYALLLASGAIGIAVGDTLLFKSLNTIGAGASALLSCLYSPFIIALSFVWLGERLTLLQLAGVALILSAVLETTWGRATVVDKRRRLAGVAWGVLSMAAMAVGIVMVKPLLDRAPLLWALEIRLLGGVVALLVFLAINPARRRIISTLATPRDRRWTVSSSLIGGYVAMVCWLGGMKFTEASVAAGLNQTSTIFVILFAALILRETITKTRLVAVATAFVGVMFVIFG